MLIRCQTFLLLSALFFSLPLSAQTDIPDPDSLVEKHITAIGGRDLYDGILTGDIRFKESIPGNHTNEHRILFATEDRYRYSTHMSLDNRSYVRTLNKQNGWHHEIFKGKIEKLRRISFNIEEYNAFSPTGIERYVYPKTEYRNSKTVAVINDGKKTIYEVLFDLNDSRKIREFFDKKTGLRVATWIEAYRFKVDAENPVSIRKFQYEDYKKTKYGILIPNIVKSNSSTTHDAVYKIESAIFNLELPAAEFQKPRDGD